MCSILGPSGCGKSTLLRMIAGLETADMGRICIEGQDITGRNPEHRPVNLVFQSYALFPHMTVEENIGYGLKVAKLRKSERSKRICEAIELTHLTGLEKRKPTEISGGQQQRVALARALIMRPKVLLLDEPLSALDANLRLEMRDYISSLRSALNIAFVMATHDQAEALAISDKLVYMADGRIMQEGSPEELYYRPVNQEVASFIGKITLIKPDKKENSTHSLIAKQVSTHTAEFLDSATFGIRPGALSLVVNPVSNAISLPVSLERIEFNGSAQNAFVLCGDGTNLNIQLGNNQQLSARENIHVSISSHDLLLFSRSGKRL